MTKNFAEFIILCLFLLLAVFLYQSTASYPESVQGSTATYVRFLGSSLGILCIIELVLWLKSKKSSEQKTAEKLNIAEAPVRFWSLLILLFVYALLLEPLGFYLASIIFLPVSMYALGSRKILSVCLTSGGVMLFVYVVFAKLLGVPLPESIWF